MGVHCQVWVFTAMFLSSGSDEVEVIYLHADVSVYGKHGGEERDQQSGSDDHRRNQADILPLDGEEPEAEAVESEIHHASDHQERQDGRSEAHEHASAYYRAFDYPRRSAYQFHRMDEEAARIDGEADGVDYQHDRDKQ